MTAGEEKIVGMITELDKNLTAKISDLTRTMEVCQTSHASCKEKCDKTHKVVFGNGMPGIASRVWVLWGAFTAMGGVILAVVKGWIGISQ